MSMEKIEALIQEMKEVAYHPRRQMDKYKASGKKVIGCMPYYVPEELVYAAGMVPMGMWGSNKKTISRAKEYCATFYCTIAQLDLEMLLDGTLEHLDGVITPTPCDTLRPMSQNVKVAVGDRIPAIFLAHPQRRTDEAGKEFTMHQYTLVKEQLEKIAGTAITDAALADAIRIYNKSRAARRRFVELAGQHPEAVSAVNRSAVIKASYFMLKDAYTEKLEELNDALAALPKSEWKGVRVMTSGIICDNPELLKLFDENHMAIVADDVAQETRSFLTDVPEDMAPMAALCEQWANTGCDPIFWDKDSRKHTRAKALIRRARRSGAQGFILFMMQFCDPEETDYPHLKHDLEIADIPHIKLGIDQQMRNFGQISTSLQAFVDVLTEYDQ